MSISVSVSFPFQYGGPYSDVGTFYDKILYEITMPLSNTPFFSIEAGQVSLYHICFILSHLQYTVV